MAVQLRAAGAVVEQLVLIDALRDGAFQGLMGEDQLVAAIELVKQLMGPAFGNEATWREKLAAVEPRRWEAVIYRELAADGSLDEGQRTWFQRLFDLHQAHESAFAAFTPGTYAGPVHLVRAAQTAAVYAADDSYGWRAHCSHLTIHQIDGSHTGIWSEADGLAQLLEDL